MDASGGLTLAQTEDYVRRYVNARTLDWGEDGRIALAELYRLAEDAKILPKAPPVTFLPIPDEEDG